ncbi:MAG: VOC family protein [Chloroflexota bacterium]
MTYKVGSIGWVDLTVDDADGIRDFYKAVVGWEAKPHAMGEYNDYDISNADGEVVTGICHKRGINADIPSQWMIYIVVADVDASVKTVIEQGGEVVSPAKQMGDGKVVIIKDPAGAVCALMEVTEEQAE